MAKIKKNNMLVYVLIIIVLLLGIIYYIKINSKIRYIESFNNSNSLPKIIHQSAPADVDKWKPEWVECHKTWKKIFPEPEYKHIMWTDEDINNFIKTYYPDYYDIFMSYDKKIKRFDMVRCFFLYKYGGIYADMDCAVFKNFYDLIPHDKVSIVRSPYPWEYLQNCLMTSPVNNPFWL